MWDFPKLRVLGYLILGSKNKDPTILGSPIFGNPHVVFREGEKRRGAERGASESNIAHGFRIESACQAYPRLVEKEH